MLAFFTGLLWVMMTLVSIFLILVILIQRGRGGGLVGAFGGAGGSSAFGTKAGDVFTRFTIVVAVIWFLVCMALVRILLGGSQQAEMQGGFGASRAITQPAEMEGADGSGDTGSGAGAAAKLERGSSETMKKADSVDPLDPATQVGPETIDIPPIRSNDDQ